MTDNTLPRSSAPLPDHFEAEDHGKHWHLFCRVCGRGWALNKDNTHIGAELRLLDHAYSHKDTKDDEA